MREKLTELERLKIQLAQLQLDYCRLRQNFDELQIKLTLHNLNDDLETFIKDHNFKTGKVDLQTFEIEGEKNED